jgi:hypothetical protein
MTERTIYQANLDLTYSIRLWELQRRYWQRVDGFMFALIILGTGSAFTAIVDPKSGSSWALVAGLLIAIASTLRMVLRTASKIADANERVRTYCSIRSEALEFDLKQLDAALRKAERSDPESLDSLRLLAAADNLTQSGHEDEVDPASKRVLARWLMLA